MAGKLIHMWVVFLFLATGVTAHTGEHHMSSSMFGWHWSGMLLMISLWVLIILAIVYLLVKISDEVKEQGED